MTNQIYDTFKYSPYLILVMPYIWIPDHLFETFCSIYNSFLERSSSPSSSSPSPSLPPSSSTSVTVATTPTPTTLPLPFFIKKLSPQGLIIAYLRLFTKQIKPCYHPHSRIKTKNGLVYCKHCLEAFVEEEWAETLFHKSQARFVVIHNKNMLSLDDMYALVFDNALQHHPHHYHHQHYQHQQQQDLNSL